MSFNLDNKTYTFTPLYNLSTTITNTDSSKINLQDVGDDEDTFYTTVNNNFKYLKQLLFENKKNISFLDFLQIVGYVTEENLSSIYNLFYQLAPGECLGIDVDYAVFNGELSLNRGDYLLKLENGEPLRVPGPANLVYIPYLSFSTSNHIVNLNFYSDLNPNLQTGYDYLKPTSATTGLIYNGESSENVTWDTTQNSWKFNTSGEDTKFVNAMPQYKFTFSEIGDTSYNSCFNLTMSESHSVPQINNLYPIIKTYYNNEDIYGVINYTLSDSNYIITNTSNLTITVEVK